jgi:hypothetical protein
MANKRFSSGQKSSESVSQFLLGTTSTLLLSFSLLTTSAFAKDPFRTTNPKVIGDRTEAAFRAVFERGNYPAARKELEQAEADEPLTYAMRAAMVYIDFQAASKDKPKQAELLEQFKANGLKVREVAKQLMNKDKLRGNLYLAVSHFFDGGYIILRDGTVKGTPQALTELQQAFRYLDAAEAIAPQDPELNLIKGYMDLLLAANLPFSSPDKAIERLEKYAEPKYLANRGLAIGFLALKQPDKALAAVDRALSQTRDNPELMYLKGQILYKNKNYQAALVWFDNALKKKDQLPEGMVRQIAREQKQANRKLAGAK